MASAATWTDESTLRLIELYKAHPIIWDPKDPNHFRKALKADAWIEIATILERDVEECRKKIASTLATFRKERAKKKNSLGTGKGADEVYHSRWFAYKALEFIEDKDQPRKRLNSAPLNDIHSDVLDVVDVEDDDIEPGPSAHDERNTLLRDARASTPRRVRHNSEPNRMAEILSVMKTAANNLGASSQCDAANKHFCSFLLSKMNSFSAETTRRLQCDMFALLQKAECGQYEEQQSHVLTNNYVPYLHTYPSHSPFPPPQSHNNYPMPFPYTPFPPPPTQHNNPAQFLHTPFPPPPTQSRDPPPFSPSD